MRLAVRLLLPVLLVALLGAAACTGTRPLPLTGTLSVHASPTFAEIMAELTRAFQASHPSVRVETLYEPHSSLVEQISAGLRPDVILAEDPEALTAAGVTADPLHLALGQIVLAVRADNPALVNGLAALNRPDVRVAMCAAEEPCGRIAADVLEAAQVPTPPTALTEPDVRAALAHVIDGTADVALVYRADAVAAGDAIATIEVVESARAMADLVAATPPQAANPAVARAFLDLLAAPSTRDLLTQAGFRPPQ
jgi:molybdate transport system substrate-binding protein